MAGPAQDAVKARGELVDTTEDRLGASLNTTKQVTAATKEQYKRCVGGWGIMYWMWWHLLGMLVLQGKRWTSAGC